MTKALFLSVSVLGLVLAGPALSQSSLPQVAVGQTLQGQIGPDDPRLDSDESNYKLYRVQVPSGQLVTVTLSSRAFQPVLAVHETIDEDCDACSTTVGERDKPAVVRMMAPQSGELQIRVNTMNQGDRGPFTLLVNATAPPPISAKPLTLGQSVSESLSPTDAVGDDGNLVDAYALRLAANQEIQLDLASEDFDPKLELLTPAGAKAVEDDDGGPGVSARIRFKVPRAGVYQVRVMSVGSSQAGSYDLSTGLRQPVVPMPAPTTVAIGQTMTASIEPRTAHYENEGEEISAVRYAVRLDAGKIYRVSAAPGPESRLDPKVLIGKIADDGTMDSVAQDDDSGGDRVARLRFRPQNSGIYVAEVQKVGSSFGAYTFLIEQAPDDRAPAPTQAVRVGQSVSGELSDGGARLAAKDALFNTYSVALRAGQKVSIKMEKEGETNLDPLLEIGPLSAAAFEAIASDDDGGQGLNARVKFVAPSDGTYLIRATANEATQEGRYTLSLTETPPSVTPPAPTRAKLGETIRGNLGAGDPMRNDSQLFDRYVFSGEVGETYEITASAADFDIIVGARQIDRVDDDYASDDDSGGGTNAKLVYTVTQPGPQVIRVTTVEESTGGAYTLLIIKK